MAGRASTRRRAIVLACSLVVPIALVFGLGHRGEHMARNLLVPGAGLWEEHLWLGVLFTVGAVAATVAWAKWGADWMVAAVVLGSVLASGLWAPGDHDVASSLDAVPMAHEFPLVVLVVAAISWLKALTARVPLLHRLGVRRTKRARAVDHARAVAVAALVPGAGRSE
ncbi:MAG TPA: hypothetical protein DCR14_20870, partial [Acidimicrobiaceae bacterium]|nr:hypothetical protein [Acidimicrobiaceae bacterium]